MAKRMLIDATHPEETRVVVTSGNRLEEFDFESSTKRQVKGNIYLAKVTRVEPSLQAAFVDYGGNRHGFLAFSEIHPDYYRIPVSDRHAGDPDSDDYPVDPEHGGEDAGVPLSAALPEPVSVPQGAPTEDGADDDADNGGGYADSGAAAHAASSHDNDRPHWASFDERADVEASVASEPAPGRHNHDEPAAAGAVLADALPADALPADALPTEAAPPETATTEGAVTEVAPTDVAPTDVAPTDVAPVAAAPIDAWATPSELDSDAAVVSPEEAAVPPQYAASEDAPPPLVSFAEEPENSTEIRALRSTETALLTVEIGEFVESESSAAEGSAFADTPASADNGDSADGFATGQESVETLGGGEVEEVEEADAERRWHHSRHYKIQEVVKRRQIMLVQVAKEERGNKGAALTTYLSLAGRYCVLMPNTNRGGGVSRKITSIADRRRLKDIVEDLAIPEGMGVIVRTAGAERSKAEIKRDYEYLLRLWNEIRDLTLQSTAPALIYEEGNLIKRSIRDLYTRDLEEVLVEGDEGYRTAKAFMRTLMPSHARRVQPYRDPQVGLFHRFQIESQIDAIHSPVAQLRSGGYTVINQTEALVAIDVNSGRSTRERNIEETALRTNLEAADELARQLRLRDLAGLIVIDFIDMEEHRNQVAVERRLKEALKNDRARIQVGRISPFGLLEMSRQRLRPSLAETSTQPCPHCAGTGFIRSVESTALYVLRSIEEEGIRLRSAEICIYVPTNVALYILNQKRESLNQIEARYGMRVTVAQDDALIPPSFRLERLRAFEAGEAPALRPIQAPTILEDEEDDELENVETLETETDGEGSDATAAQESQESDEERGRRRRRRRRRRPDEPREGRVSSLANEGDIDEPAEAGSENRTDNVRTEDSREAGGHDGDGEGQRRRRGRRGGRMRPRRDAAAQSTDPSDAEAMVAEGDVFASHENEPAMSEPVPWSPDGEVPDGEIFEAAAAASPASHVESFPVEAALSEREGAAAMISEEPPEVSGDQLARDPLAGDQLAGDSSVWGVSPDQAPASEEAVPVEAASVEAEAPAATVATEAPAATVAAEAPVHEIPAYHVSAPAAVVAEPEAPVEEVRTAPHAAESEPPPSAEAEQGVPFVSESERVLEDAAAAPVAYRESTAELAHAPDSAHVDDPVRVDDDVQTVTEKPSNPRKGWWQRLMQS
ncbi:MAG TPA: Rne/Rng family ribonuclease [Stellaceae bacterium]|jgi:ribonuclease E|nr:Rne/Rng family ribonuclease [Stellaceae bacterium]